MSISDQSMNVRKVLYGGTPPGELLSELRWNWARRYAEVGNFWYEFAPNGYIPLSDFSKIWHGEGSPRSHPHGKFYRFGLVNVSLQPQNIAKNANFWYTFAPKGYIPFGDFYKILPGGGSPKTAL